MNNGVIGIVFSLVYVSNGTSLQYSCLEKSHGWRSLEGCSPWGRWGSDMTERLHFHFSLSCIGEGNGIPLQCSCLENPRDGGAWWAAVYGVAQSRTRLKWLSSSSSSSKEFGVVGSDTYTWSIKDFHKCWSRFLAKRRLCLGPAGVINCTSLSALSFWVSLFPWTRGYNKMI